LNDILVSTTT